MKKEEANRAKGKAQGSVVDMINSAKSRLYDRLVQLDPKAIGLSEYNQRYLGSKIQYVEATLDLYGKLLLLAFEGGLVPPEDFSMVDYGGGSGLITLLAVEAGFGRVIYNDIYEVSCADVKKLSEALGMQIDHVVLGDVEDLITYLRRQSLSVDAIVSNDVLEHIYDVPAHFRHLASLSGNSFRVVHATGANSLNWRYVSQAKKDQIEVEYENREAKWGHKARDTLQAYLEVRRTIISEYAPELVQAQVEELARATRGLMKQDIEKCVDEYQSKGSISYQPNHPTNTCDPLTGNWCEHLMSFDWLEQAVEASGFSVRIFPGSYFVSGSFPKRNAKILINTLLQVFGRRFMFLAPYFVLIAELP
jgi:2-polyprenyl-3-methyl-5-hydroxy-6-metoxy-1,4-benzoquinol methylase